MRFWKRIFPFLLLNILVSAGTTLLVLSLWDNTQRSPLAGVTGGIPDGSLPPGNLPITTQPLEAATPTLPPLEEPVILIETVIGAGDPNSEAVVLRRVGEGDLALTGWRLSNGRGAEFVFPNLVLSRNGSVRLYSRVGNDTVIELFWGRGEAAWRPGDIVTLLDYAGNVRASYTIP